MSQQEFLESPRHYEEISAYEEQTSIESSREYTVWEQNNEFFNRHLHGEKVLPQASTKAAVWSLLPLLVLLFVIGGGAFGLTAAFDSTYQAQSQWNDGNFAPRPGWYHHHPFHHHPFHHPFHRSFDSGQQMAPDGPGIHLEQGAAPNQIIIVTNN